MFQALMPLLLQCKSLDVKIVATSEDALTVIVLPLPKDGQKEAALRTPIKLEGTVAELDAGFTNAIGTLAASRASLIDSVETMQVVIDAAKKDVEAKTVKAVQGNGKGKGTKPALPAPSVATASTTPDEDADLDTEGDSDISTPAIATAAAPAAAPAKPDPTADLFTV